MANDKKFVPKNGLRTQNISFVDADPAVNEILVRMVNTDTLSFSGESGQLFSITDSMSGTIFAVNDISGTPSIEVDDDGTIRLAELFGNVLIGTNVDDGSSKLQIQGDVAINGSEVGFGDTTLKLIAAAGNTLSTIYFSEVPDTQEGRIEYSYSLSRLRLSAGNASEANSVKITSGLLEAPSLTVADDLAINGGDLTTTATTFNLLDTTATTLNIGGDATAISIGANTGLTTIEHGLTVAGDLTVSGTTTTVNTTNLDVQDAVITLNKNQLTPLNDIGILMQRYATADATNYNIAIAWDEGTDRLIIGKTPEDGSDNDISFNTEWMTIKDTGNVGIGTADPESLLHIENTSGTSAEMYIAQQKTFGLGEGTAERAKLILSIKESTKFASQRAFAEFSAGTIDEQSSNDGFLDIGVRGLGAINNVMRLTHEGNVGIGTDSPANNGLTIQKSTFARLRLAETSVRSWDMEATGGDWRLNNASNSLEALRVDENAVVTHGGLGQYRFSETAQSSIETNINKDGNHSLSGTFGARRNIVNVGSNYVSWDVSAPKTQGSAPVWTTQMRLDSNGNVGIGTDSPYSRLDVDDEQTAAYSTTIATTGGNPSGVEISNIINGDTTSTNFKYALQGWHIAAGTGQSNVFGRQGLVRTGSNTSAFVWQLRTTTDTTNTTEMMRIASDGVVSMSANISSTTTTSGTLVVTGGVGISENLNVGGTLTLSSTGPAQLVINADTDNIIEQDNASILLTQDGGAVTAYIGFEVGQNDLVVRNDFSAKTSLATGGSNRLEVENTKVSILPTTTSTTTTSGALTVAGGVGISENLNVGGEFKNFVPAGAKNPQIYKAQDDTGGVSLGQNRARGTLDIPTALIDGDIVGGLNGWAHDGTDYLFTAAIRYKIDGTVSTGVAPQKIVFETSETNGIGLAERLIIKPNGDVDIAENLNIGSLIQVNNATPVLALNDTDATTNTNQVGYISFRRQGTESGWVGFGDSVNDKLTVRNTSGPVVLQPSTEVQVASNLDVTGNLEINSTATAWSETQPGTTIGSIHLNPSNTADNVGNAITWGAHDSSNGDTAQAGIYVRSDSTYGTRMYFATTDSYAAGSKVRITINHLGQVGITSDLNVGGALTATSKSFDIEHPTKEGQRLRYGSLEGPENGVYVRGKGSNKTIIELPDYWTGLVHEDSITVSLTPIGGHNDLWVEKIEDNKVYIQLAYPGEYFYHVFAERKDIDKLTVEYEAE